MNVGTMYQRINQKDEKGFTLIEVLVAMAVFAVGILAAISMQSSATLTGNLARNSTEAATQAADLLERLNTLPYDDPTYLSAGAHSVGPGALDLREGQFSMANGANLIPDVGIYSFRYSITQDAMIPNTKTIAITVSYVHLGQTRTVQLVSVKPDTI